MAPQPQRAAEARTTGLLGSLRRLGASVVAMLHSRVELLARELERERVRVTRLLVLAMIALFFLALGALTATVFVIALFWDSQRLMVIGFLTLLYLGVGAAVAIFARREALRGARPFSASLAQLEKDREQLDPD